MIAEITAIYRASKKKKDINWWTEWVCRPLAAAVVYGVRNTRITPNQLTFMSLALAALAGALFALTSGYLGLCAAALVFELSFVLDCADGQLARLRRTASRLGHHLDFLMDEIKAHLIFGCVAIRLWQVFGDDTFLAVGIAGMFVLTSGIGMTALTRRPEWGAAPPTEDGQPAQVAQRSGAGAIITWIEHAARIIVHYPSYIWLVALIGRIDLYFWAYAAVNALYAAKQLALIFLRLGRARST